MMLNDLLRRHSVNIITGHRIESVNEKGAVVVPSGGGANIELAADSVVIAIGFSPIPSMANELRGTGAEIYEIGDGKKVGNIMYAISDAYEVSRSI